MRPQKLNKNHFREHISSIWQMPHFQLFYHPLYKEITLSINFYFNMIFLNLKNTLVIMTERVNSVKKIPEKLMVSSLLVSSNELVWDGSGPPPTIVAISI